MCLVTLHKQRITLSLPLIVIGQSAYSHHLASNQHTHVTLTLHKLVSLCEKMVLNHSNILLDNEQNND